MMLICIQRLDWDVWSVRDLLNFYEGYGWAFMTPRIERSSSGCSVSASERTSKKSKHYYINNVLEIVLQLTMLLP